MRTDIHRTSEVIPADYRELFCYAHRTVVDGWPVPGYNMERVIAQRIGRHYNHFDGTSADPVCDDSGHPNPMWEGHHGGAQCDSCGARFVEGSIFLHEPSGECVAFGHICAKKMAIAMDRSSILSMQGDRQNARKNAIEKAARFSNLRDFVRESDAELLEALKVDHRIVRDIRSRVIRLQNITQPQEKLVKKIAAELKAPEKPKAKAPCEGGRTVVEGKIKGVKWHDSDYGQTLKITVEVETEDGAWKCWGTAPASIVPEYETDLKGCMVRFTAALSRSNTDESFAFFKRPTKAVVIKKAA